MLNSSTNKYGRQGQFLFLIGYCLKKSSPLKLLGKMEPSLAGSIYVRSSIKFLHLVPFGQQTWLPRLIEDYNMKKLMDGRRMPSDGNTSHGPFELKNDKKGQ
jgi:hypothetical protein